MNDSASTPSPSSSWRRQCRRLLADCRAMAEARWRLAAIECRIATRQIGRLAAVWSLAVAALLSATTLALVAVSDAIAQLSGISRAVWLSLIAATLALLAVAASWFAWRRFRRQFVGLEETLEELHEDVVWLREWLDHTDDQQAATTTANNG